MSDGGGHGDCIHTDLQKAYAGGKVESPALRFIVDEHLKICDACQQEVAKLSYDMIMNLPAFRGLE